MAPKTRMPFYTNDEIRVLKRAFDLACADLGLEPGRRGQREQLGCLIFEIAATGVDDCTALRRRSVRRFRSSFAAGRPPVVSENVPALVVRLTRPSSGEPRK